MVLPYQFLYTSSIAAWVRACVRACACACDRTAAGQTPTPGTAHQGTRTNAHKRTSALGGRPGHEQLHDLVRVLGDIARRLAENGRIALGRVLHCKNEPTAPAEEVRA